jgi:hypothetical protein
MLTAENAYLDRGFGPASHRDASLMDRQSGPTGTSREVFQTNFAFGRTVRLAAQSIDPGYWQSPPNEVGYKPEQVMRYSEGNLNRLQIAGELHVKSGNPRGSAGRTRMSARLRAADHRGELGEPRRCAHTSARLRRNAVVGCASRAICRLTRASARRVVATGSILGDAGHVGGYGANAVLDRLHAQARLANFEASGRIRSTASNRTAVLGASTYPSSEQHATHAKPAASWNGFIRPHPWTRPMAIRSDGWHRHRIHRCCEGAGRAGRH